MRGGKRQRAGRPKGSKDAVTLEKEAVQRAYNQRVMRQADAIFNAQLALAVGSIQVFRVDEEEGSHGKVKRVHTLVTDPEEIREVLDEHQGGPGIVGQSYYFVSDTMPQNAAIESMLNRSLGKPIDRQEIIEDPRLAQLKQAIKARAEATGVTYQEELTIYLENYSSTILPAIREKLADELVKVVSASKVPVFCGTSGSA